jgi:hypothetical protein
MKKITTYLFLMLLQISAAQNSANSVDLKEVQILNSTALALLDNSAAIVTSNPDYKDFNINTENLSNLSFDFSLNKGKLNGLEYYGIGKTINDFKQFTSDKLLRPNVSAVVHRTDSTTNIGAGFSVNVFTLFRKKKEDMQKAYAAIRNTTAEMITKADLIMARDFPNLNKVTNLVEYNEQYTKILESLPTVEANEFAELLKRPLLTLDLAAAYSTLYDGNNYNSNQKDRTGVWSTITWSPKIDKSYLNIYGFIRYIKDQSVYNENTKNFSDQFEYFDYGSKIQIDINSFSFGYEYIRRNGNGKDYRSVGLIQYKISANYYVTGGFGKNFTSDSSKNLVSLLGIRWGINKSETKKWEE